MGSKVGEEARQGSYSRQPVAIGKALSRAVFPEQQRYSHIEAYVVCFERRAQSKTCLSQVCFSVEQQRDHQNWPCRFWKCTQYDMIGSEDKKSSCQSCFIPSPTCQKRWFFFGDSLLPRTSSNWNFGSRESGKSMSKITHASCTTSRRFIESLVGGREHVACLSCTF